MGLNWCLQAAQPLRALLGQGQRLQSFLRHIPALPPSQPSLALRPLSQLHIPEPQLMRHHNPELGLMRPQNQLILLALRHSPENQFALLDSLGLQPTVPPRLLAYSPEH